MAHVEDAPAGLADDGEGFEQEVVEGGALSDLLLELDGFGGEIGVREGAHGRFEIADGRDHRLHALDLALGFGAEDFRQDFVDNHECSRYGERTAILF